MALAAMLVKNGIDITRVTWNQTSPMMSWRIGYLYLIAPISGALMLFFCVRHALAVLRAR
jgi:TRAP-type C4-dicarboxylate transport system permease small subunit